MTMRKIALRLHEWTRSSEKNEVTYTLWCALGDFAYGRSIAWLPFHLFKFYLET